VNKKMASAKEIQNLRQTAGVGMMEAKKALEANGGDFDAAVKWLREQGLASMAKRADRENAQGAVAVGSADGAVSLVQVKCETDFVAKSPDFVAMVQAMADSVAAKGEDGVKDHQATLDQLIISLKENIEMGKVVRFAPAAGTVVDSYLHIQSERGVNGTLVEVSGASQDVAHDIALHIAFAKPSYLTRDEVPAELIAAERETLEQLSRNEGKPEAALPKIVEGRINGWYKERVLLEQEFAKDNKQTIQGLLGKGTITRFAQVTIG
jgi:elongation factor Ts